MPDAEKYSLPVCILIALAPLLLAALVIWFAEPRGRLVLDFRPLNWLADYVLIWPLVWVSADILSAGKWLWLERGGQVNLQMALRLSGGFLLIYVCIWLLAVPLINQAGERFSWLHIAPASYSQLWRFLFGAAVAVIARLARELSAR